MRAHSIVQAREPLHASHTCSRWHTCETVVGRLPRQKLQQGHRKATAQSTRILETKALFALGGGGGWGGSERWNTGQLSLRLMPHGLRDIS